jgi:hypothetical protein
MLYSLPILKGSDHLYASYCDAMNDPLKST